MANRVEIFVDVDPSGRGAQAIRGIRADIKGLERETNRAGSAGRDALGGFAGGLGIPTSIAAVTASIGAGIAAVSYQSVQASNDGANAQRILRSEAQSTGVSFEYAERNAHEFAKTLALTDAEAERNVGKFLRLAKAAGELGNFETHRKNLENLTAAYALSATEINNLTQQLLSGQDEALNRLGIADPSQLYKKYAKEVGTTVEALTDEEKVRARLLAVSEKGAGFEGAAIERLNSQVGLWAQLTAGIGNASRNLGDYLQKQTFIGDIPALLTGQSSGDVLNARVQAAQRRAEAEARTRADVLKATTDQLHLSAQLAKDPSRKFEDFDFFTASINLTPEKEQSIREQAKRAGEVARDELSKVIDLEKSKAGQDALDRLANTASTPEGDAIRRKAVAEARAKVEAERAARLDVAGTLAEGGVERAARLEAVRTEATAQRGVFEKQYTDLFKDKKLDVITLGFAERQFQAIKGIFDPARRAEIAEGIRELYLRFEKEAATYLGGVRKQAEGLFNTLATRYAGDANNPFVKIFSEADESARRLEKTFGVLGQRAVGELKRIEAEFFRQQALAAQLDATLKSQELRRRAEDFLKPDSRLSGQDEQAIAVLERRLEAIKTTAELGARADAISRGLGKGGLDEALEKNKEGILGVQFRGLRDALGKVRGTGEVDQEQRSRIYRTIADIFEQLSPETQRKISRGSIEGGDTFIEAYRGLQKDGERRVQQELDKARYLDEQVRAARDDIGAIENARRGGLGNSEADQRLLRRLQGLPENLLTNDLRRAGFDASTREAERTANEQKAARDAVDKARESTDKLTTSVDKLAQAIQSPNQRKLLIEILNRSRADVKDHLYGSLNPLPASPGTGDDPFNR